MEPRRQPHYRFKSGTRPSGGLWHLYRFRGRTKNERPAVSTLPEETREVRLEFQQEGEWQQIQSATVNDLGWSALFRVENWDDTKNVPTASAMGKKPCTKDLFAEIR